MVPIGRPAVDDRFERTLDTRVVPEQVVATSIATGFAPIRDTAASKAAVSRST
jgi:hypothetical protein